MGMTKKGWKKRKLNGNGEPWNKGKKLPKLSNVHKLKISNSINNSKKYKQSRRSKVFRNKMRISQLGQRNRMANLATRLKMTLTRRSQDFRGSKSASWKPNKDHEYSIDWTHTLKRSIRERDHYTCQLCSEPQGEKALDVHHIDYNKKNCSPNNLISLCHKCHMKTNTKSKEKYWKEYFKSLMNVVA
jgi:5-methylcytosine-specific restriction endonuclease McrA